MCDRKTRPPILGLRLAAPNDDKGLPAFGLPQQFRKMSLGLKRANS